MTKVIPIDDLLQEPLPLTDEFFDATMKEIDAFLKAEKKKLKVKK